MISVVGHRRDERRNWHVNDHHPLPTRFDSGERNHKTGAEMQQGQQIDLEEAPLRRAEQSGYPFDYRNSRVVWNEQLKTVDCRNGNSTRQNHRRKSIAKGPWVPVPTVTSRTLCRLRKGMRHPENLRRAAAAGRTLMLLARHRKVPGKGPGAPVARACRANAGRQLATRPCRRRRACGWGGAPTRARPRRRALRRKLR